MKRDIGLHGASRREFIKGIMAASAAMGLGPLRALEVLDHLGGSALAQEACPGTALLLNLVAGTGGLSWFQALWPVPGVMVNPPSHSALAPLVNAVTVVAPQGDPDSPRNHPLYARIVPGTRGQPLFGAYNRAANVTAVLCGRSSAHQIAPNIVNNTNTITDGVGGEIQVFAAAAALQDSLPALLPVVGVPWKGVEMPYTKASAPMQASAPRRPKGTADTIIGLFSSAAELVSTRQYQQAWRSLLQTGTEAQDRDRDARLALQGAGKNIALRLDYRGVDLTQVVGTTVVKMAKGGQANALALVDLAQGLIVSLKAFQMGLTAQVNLPVFNDDPHTAFTGRFFTPIADGLAMCMDWFMGQMVSTRDPACAGKSLADNLVISISGDMPKDPFSSAGDWNDAPAMAANWVYIIHNGELVPGWFGDMEPTRKRQWDPSLNQLSQSTQDQAMLERPMNNGALAGLLYAVAQGKKARVKPLFSGDFDFLAYGAALA
jgi:hypothetical protein